MRSPIYWIDTPAPGRLGIMARPRAGEWLDEEVAGWKAADVAVVVCLLEKSEIDELGLGDEGTFCRRRGIEFLSFPIPDRGHPESMRQTETFARAIAANLKGGSTVAIHCRAGIGRSSLIAACTLVGLGFDATTAFDLIANARGLKVPDTEEQRNWVISFEAAIR
jgi:protein-tyrosine phosphatase